MSTITVQELVNRNGTNFCEEDVDFHSSPVVSSYLSECATNFALALLRTAAVAELAYQNNLNHYSSYGVITILVRSVHYFRSSYAAYLRKCSAFFIFFFFFYLFVLTQVVQFLYKFKKKEKQQMKYKETTFKEFY